MIAVGLKSLKLNLARLTGLWICCKQLLFHKQLFFGWSCPLLFWLCKTMQLFIVSETICIIFHSCHCPLIRNQINGPAICGYVHSCLEAQSYIGLSPVPGTCKRCKRDAGIGPGSHMHSSRVGLRPLGALSTGKIRVPFPHVVQNKNQVKL